MNKLKQRVQRGLLHAPNPYYPFMFGVLALMFGVWVTMPWDVYHFGALWSFLRAIAIPEVLLGGVGILVGLLSIGGVTFKRPAVTRAGALLAFYYWGFIGLSFMIGNWRSPSGLFAIFMAVMCGLGWINRQVGGDD